MSFERLWRWKRGEQEIRLKMEKLLNLSVINKTTLVKKKLPSDIERQGQAGNFVKDKAFCPP